MTLEEAYKITGKMTNEDDVHPTDLQREAKELIYQKVIEPRYPNGAPYYLEPDFKEGWE
jgi:hypothetical protein